MSTATNETNNEAQNESHNRNVKNFRSSPDVENFYRFINENNLRREAQKAIEAIYDRIKLAEKKSKRKRKKKVLQ
jgi:hypothetical protein